MLSFPSNAIHFQLNLLPIDFGDVSVPHLLVFDDFEAFVLSSSSEAVLGTDLTESSPSLSVSKVKLSPGRFCSPCLPLSVPASLEARCAIDCLAAGPAGLGMPAVLSV